MRHMKGGVSMKRDAEAVADILKILIENKYSAAHAIQVLEKAQDEFLANTEYTTDVMF